MHSHTAPAGGVRIVGVGHVLPPRVVTNDHLAARIDTSDEWITSRVGIRERRYADEDSVAALATEAARRAVVHAGWSADSVDLVIVATMTAQDRSPSTAASVARALGCTGPAAFDLNAACAGFSQAIAVASHALQAKSARRALVIGAERMSDFLDHDDRSTAVLMGDGAGAVAMESAQSVVHGPVVWGTDLSASQLIRIQPPRMLFDMDGPPVFRWAITHAAKVAQDALDAAHITVDELAAFVAHQANGRILAAITDRLGVPAERVADTIAFTGNTSAASIPLALSCHLERVGQIDGPVLLLGFGGGMSYCAQVVPTRLAVTA